MGSLQRWFPRLHTLQENVVYIYAMHVSRPRMPSSSPPAPSFAAACDWMETSLNEKKKKNDIIQHHGSGALCSWLTICETLEGRNSLDSILDHQLLSMRQLAVKMSDDKVIGKLVASIDKEIVALQKKRELEEEPFRSLQLWFLALAFFPVATLRKPCFSIIPARITPWLIGYNKTIFWGTIHKNDQL